MEIDPIDRKILEFLQANGKATHAEIAEAVPLSGSQIQRRVKRLEDDQVILGYTTIVSAKMLGFNVQAFTSVSLRNQKDDDAKRFQTAVSRIEAVTECLVVSGESDYMLRVIAADLESLSQIIRSRILSLPMVARVSSQIVFEAVKTGGRVFG